MQQATIQRALDSFGLKYQHVRPVQSGYRNYIYPVELSNGDLVNLLVYKSESDILSKIQNANRVSNFLATTGLPTRRQLDPRTLVMASQTNNRKSYACLYNYLPGSTIPWEAYTKSHIKLIGKTLAIIHQNMADITQGSLPNQDGIVNRQTSILKNYFSQAGVIAAMQQKLKLKIDTATILGNRDALVERKGRQQIIHMDFVRGNILFDTSQSASYALTEKNIAVSGILDFEKLSYGSINHDIGRTLAFLLVDCKYKQASKIYKYFINSGYIKRGANEIDDLQSLQNFVVFYLTYDFYKFLLHNPYESLAQNEHYLRTRDILIKTKVLEQI